MSGSQPTNVRALSPLARLRAAIEKRERIAIADETARRAAVLVPIVGDEPEPRLLFFLRTADVWEHKSEVCFPGGSVEPRDADATAAALREAEEELGIRQRDVEIVGLLDDVLTHVSGYVITPVVGHLREMPELRPDPLEVERPLIVPLGHLMKPGVERNETTEIGGTTRLRYYYAFDGLRIWGATGRIVHGMLALIREPGEEPSS